MPRARRRTRLPRVLRRPVVPKSRPKASANAVLAFARRMGLPHGYEGALLVLCRDYYLRSQGDPDRGDRGTYDGAAWLVELDAGGGVLSFQSYNCNTEPHGAGDRGDGKGFAVLEPGVHEYRFGLHRGKYLALKPYSAVLTGRDGTDRVHRNATINIHAGGFDSTWSLGCVTVPKNQYGRRTRRASQFRSIRGFIGDVWRAAARHRQGANDARGAGWKAFPERVRERPIPVVLGTYADFHAAPRQS